MTEPLIAAAESIAGPLIQQAVKDLAPEAKAILEDLHAYAATELQTLTTNVGPLMHDTEQRVQDALAEAVGRLSGVVHQIEVHLGLHDASPSSVDPTPAVPAPQTTQS